MANVELGSELDDSTTDNQQCGQQNEKKRRKRLKKICSQIRGQMEFYFSDANLNKDGFVKKLIDKREDRYVPVSVFSTFNKLRELTTDIKLVVKALSSSTKLEVSEDKQHVRRKTPYKPPKDVDDRTIYVECLPKDVDHDWLQQTFAHFGKVVYVSLPCYRTSRDLKGFAFIEFDTKEAVEKACLSYQPLDPEDKISRFPKYNKQLQSLQKQISSAGERVEERKPRKRMNKSESSNEGDGPDSALPGKRQKRTSDSSDTESLDREKGRGKDSEPPDMDKGRGRKRSAEHEGGTKQSKSSSEENQPAESSKLPSVKDKDGKSSSKKRKHTEEGDGETENKPVDDNTAARKSKIKKTLSEERIQVEAEEPRGVMIDPQKRKHLSDASESDVSGETREVKRVRISELVDVKENVEVTHKKQRNKKKKRKEAKSIERMTGEEGRPQIKVIPKHAWLELRKEYLDLQRGSMKALKKSLKNIKKRHKGADQGVTPLNTYSSIEGMATDEVLVMGGEGKQVANTGVQFTPGVIIMIDSDQPCMRKELKDTLSLVAQVPYIDFQDGDQRGFVRCATPEDALRVVASRPATFSVSLIQGEEETEYWRKISLDRDQKRAAKTRSKKRGSQKLMDRAEKTIVSGTLKKHIVFDD